MEFDKEEGRFRWDLGFNNSSLVDQVSLMCLKEMLMYCQIPCTILKEDKIFNERDLHKLFPIMFKNRRSSWELEELISDPTKVLLELRIREVFTNKKLRAFKEAENWSIKDSMLQGVVAEFRDFSEGISTDEHVHVLRKRENYREWMWRRWSATCTTTRWRSPPWSSCSTRCSSSRSTCSRSRRSTWPCCWSPSWPRP